MRISFDGEDFIHYFEDKVIVSSNEIDYADNLYAENLSLFTTLYIPVVGDTYVDVGAGNGNDIQAFSRLVGDTGRVIAIEADPNCFRRLNKITTYAKLTNVECIKAAVSNSTEKMYLVQKSLDGVTNFLIDHSTNETLELMTIKLENVFDNLKLNEIDLLKLNIEGHELQALQGMGDYLTLTKNLVVSCHDFLGKEMRTRTKVESLLSENNFSVFSIRNPLNIWETDYLFAVNLRYLDNYFDKKLNSSYNLNRANTLNTQQNKLVIIELQSHINTLEKQLMRIKGNLIFRIAKYPFRISRRSFRIFWAFYRNIFYFISGFIWKA